MALERAERKAKADVVDASADLWAKKSEYGRQDDKLKKLDQQIAKAKIHAPTDGLVIYATSAKGNWHGNQEPLMEGQEVPERTELIYLPTTSSVKAEIRLHESSLEKVSIGLPARVTVLSLPGRIFTGRVAKISPLPDAQSMWMNPDLKVYTTEVFLDGDGSDLKTGMSCRAEIMVNRYEEALSVPVQAVVQVKGKPTVFIFSEKEFEPRIVETGLDNNRMIRIVNGLNPGEKVWLTPPLHLGTVNEEEADVPKSDGATVMTEESGSALPGTQSGSPETDGSSRNHSKDGERSQKGSPRA
jgi:HlyD family secretion protein